MAKTSSKKSGNGNLHQYDCTITVGDKEMPIEVTINMIGRRQLKAVVGLSYAGVRLNDIRIFDDLFGNTLVEFPTREFTNKQGETKNVAVFYPVGEYKTAINNVILECYKDILQKDGPVFSLLRKDSVVKGKKRTSSKKSVSVNATEPVEAAETAPVAESEETAAEEQEVA